jgi:isoquinoline 1-oxidoreductase beta subunit
MAEKPAKESGHLDRRHFLIGGAVLGAGLYVGVRLAGPKLDRSGGAADASFEPNAFVRVGSDDSITVIIGKSEMGQGVYTGLAMLVAEELDVDPTRVKVEFGPADPAYNVPWFPAQFTGGSMSTSTCFPTLREAGAKARAMLLAAASQKWSVEAASLTTDNGVVRHGSRKATYGSLAEAASKLAVPEKVALKEPAQFKYLGKDQPRLDAPAKVDGSAKFGLDVRPEGMLHAVVARSPYVGGEVVAVRDAAARAVKGVVDVKQVPSGVAVYATNTWAAIQGRNALEIDWNGGPNKDFSTDALREEYRKLLGKPAIVAENKGNAASALRGARQRIDVEYELPYLAHAAMEPLNCTVDIKPDRCDIWVGTQSQSMDKAAAAAALGVDPAQVFIHTQFLGGGFGRRAQRFSEVVVEGVHVAKAIGKPVQTTWTREDDMRGLHYRPFVMSRVRAGLDGEGMPVAWQQTIVSQPVLRVGPFEVFIPKGQAFDGTSVEGAAQMVYDVPNVYVDTHEGNKTVPVLWWRSVGHSHTAFTVNSAIDELAAAAGQDAFEFRRKLLVGKPRELNVLTKVAEMANWAGGAPAGRGRGIALHASFGSIVAEVAEVSVENGRARVHKVWCAIDCGFAVNPAGVKAQMESGINYGLTAALYGQITFNEGKVVQSNFHDYPMLRVNEAPAIEVQVINSGEQMGGAGEPGTPPIAPAVTGAIFAATGKRIRKLPIGEQLA